MELHGACARSIATCLGGVYFATDLRAACRFLAASIPKPPRATADQLLRKAAVEDQVFLCALALKHGVKDFEPALRAAAYHGRATICQVIMSRFHSSFSEVKSIISRYTGLAGRLEFFLNSFGTLKHDLHTKFMLGCIDGGQTEAFIGMFNRCMNNEICQRKGISVGALCSAIGEQNRIDMGAFMLHSPHVNYIYFNNYALLAAAKHRNYDFIEAFQGSRGFSLFYILSYYCKQSDVVKVDQVVKWVMEDPRKLARYRDQEKHLMYDLFVEVIINGGCAVTSSALNHLFRDSPLAQYFPVDRSYDQLIHAALNHGSVEYMYLAREWGMTDFNMVWLICAESDNLECTRLAKKWLDEANGEKY